MKHTFVVGDVTKSKHPSYHNKLVVIRALHKRWGVKANPSSIHDLTDLMLLYSKEKLYFGPPE